jgi:hypothetical protein
MTSIKQKQINQIKSKTSNKRDRTHLVAISERVGFGLARTVHELPR